MQATRQKEASQIPAFRRRVAEQMAELEQDQLNRIERKLDQLLDHFDLAELGALPGEGSSAPSD